MRRRDLLGLLGSVTALWPFAIHAQKAMPVIGFLSGTSADSPNAPWLFAFHNGLDEAGYIEGQNVLLEYRWAEGHYDQLPAMAADLVNRKVDVIAAVSGTPTIMAAKGATSTIPIVFVGGIDLVAAGLVNSLARPGGNLTGISIMVLEMMPKRFELLADLVPQATGIALLVNPNNPSSESQIRDVQAVAHARGVQILTVKASTETEIADTFAFAAQQHVGALLVGADPLFNSRRKQLVVLARHHSIPTMHEWRESVEVGGLISYGPSFTSIMHQLGVYTGKILKGAKPVDLPIQQPSKFELVINLKTAKALGLTVPQMLLARADKIIE